MPKPFVTIELDKPRHLRYGFNQLCELEDLLGVPVSKLPEIEIGFRELRTLLYVGLRGEDPDLTPEVVGSLIDEAQSLDYVFSKVSEALQLAFGSSEEKNVQKPTA